MGDAPPSLKHERRNEKVRMEKEKLYKGELLRLLLHTAGTQLHWDL